MVQNLGWVAVGSTIRIPWNSFDAAGGSVTATGFIAADIEVYKDGSTTQRASDNGYTATTDFDSATGCHLVTIDLSDNSDAGFYAAGSEYLVMVNAVTIDGQTVRFWLSRFTIGPAPANVQQWAGSTVTSGFISGVGTLPLVYSRIFSIVGDADAPFVMRDYFAQAGGVDSLTPQAALAAVLAAVAGKTTVSGSTVQFLGRDGSTVRVAITYGAADGERLSSSSS